MMAVPSKSIEIIGHQGNTKYAAAVTAKPKYETVDFLISSSVITAASVGFVLGAVVGYVVDC